MVTAVLDLLVDVPDLADPCRGDGAQPRRLLRRPPRPAHEPRLTAAVAVTGPYSWANWNALPPPLQTTLTVRAAGHDAAAIAARIDLTGTAAGIRQPRWSSAEKPIPSSTPPTCTASPPKPPAAQLLSVPGGDHLCANTTWQWQPQTADWLADQLRASLTPPGQRNSTQVHQPNSRHAGARNTNPNR